MNPLNDATLFTATLTPGQLDARIDPKAAYSLRERVETIRAEERERARHRRRALVEAFARIVRHRTGRAKAELAERTPVRRAHA